MVKSGSYSGVMAAQCSKYGMKPVCDHPSYCQNDKNALYIGQQGHTAYPGPPRPEAPLEGPLPSLSLCLSLLSQRFAQATTALQRASAELGCSPILNAAGSSGTTATRLLRYA